MFDRITEPARLLIVEDDAIIALDLSETLTEAGFTVLGPAPDVASAVHILRTDQPDIACLDYNLGMETSAPVARRLHEAGVRFVYLTGQPALVRSDPDAPQARILRKPARPEEIIAALSREP